MKGYLNRLSSFQSYFNPIFIPSFKSYKRIVLRNNAIKKEKKPDPPFFYKKNKQYKNPFCKKNALEERKRSLKKLCFTEPLDKNKSFLFSLIGH